MRWPNRRPHSLTAGMRIAQQALAKFLPLINWQQFRRHNMNQEISVSDPAVSPFGCGDREQAILWLLRTNVLDNKGMLRQDAEALLVRAGIPGMIAGKYTITVWNTRSGDTIKQEERDFNGNGHLELPEMALVTDLAFAARRMGD